MLFSCVALCIMVQKKQIHFCGMASFLFPEYVLTDVTIIHLMSHYTVNYED